MALTPAFAPSISLTSVPKGRLHAGFSSPRRPAPVVVPRHAKRVNVQMMGPFFPNFGDSNLLKSEMVRKEMEVLERDYGELAKLGSRYNVSNILYNQGSSILS